MWACAPLMILFLVLQITLSVVSPVLSIYIPKISLDLVTGGASTARVLSTLGGLGLIMAFSMALFGMAGNGKYMLVNSMRRFYHQKLFLKSLDCDYHYVESAAGQTKYTRAVSTIRAGDWSGTSKLTVAAVDITVAVASFLIYTGIISSLNLIVVGALIVLSSVNFITVRHAQKYELGKKDETARLEKKMRYVEQTANDWKWGKDIRLYGMSGWLLETREALLGAHTALNRKVRQRYFTAGLVNALTLFLRDGLSYGYLIWSVANGAVSVGDLVLYFGAITGFSSFVGRIINDINELNGANLQMNDLRAFLDNTNAPDPANPAPLPTEGSMSIEFREVTFSYQKDGAPVLDHFNLKITAGEKIALVGVNGAGKTTIVKLLCGFYQPDAGEILIDGIDINRFRKKDLYSLFSAVFQDIFLAPFTVSENISMRLDRDTDPARVADCLEKAGLADAIAKYPDGARSYMLKAVNDGIVLSGGQQQKLLMARALYKDAPILILDEPTAALDPIAESETYERFHELARDKTSIYISHRLASTRFCDRVIYLESGRAAEAGSHEELLRLGGSYARMYEMQSHYYRKGADFHAQEPEADCRLA